MYRTPLGVHMHVIYTFKYFSDRAGWPAGSRINLDSNLASTTDYNKHLLYTNEV